MTTSKEIYFPRLVIAGASSGVGKTTVSLAIMAALAKRGFDVKPFKVGPDFIDTGYHEMVTGKISRNLDSFLIPKKRLLELFASHGQLGACPRSPDESENSEGESSNKARGRRVAGATRRSRNAEGDRPTGFAAGVYFSDRLPGSIAVIEGVMGLFDGHAVNDGIASTAEIAKLLKAPVVLVIDGSKIGQSAAALALGYKRYDKEINLAGIIINNISSARHLSIISDSLRKIGLKTLGYLSRDENVKLPERHLGLVSHHEKSDVRQTLDEISRLADKTIDVDSIIDIAKSSISLKLNFNDEHRKAVNRKRVNIAVAKDDAFYFYYQDGLEELERNGANIISFSPINDKEIPGEADGLIIGGGFPEMFASQLSANKPMIRSINDFVASNRPVYAECGGLIYLGSSHFDFNNSRFEMAGVLPIDTKMELKKRTIGYVSAKLCENSIIGSKDTAYNGHEFHWSSVTSSDSQKSAYFISKDNNKRNEGFNNGKVLASYVHLHFSGSLNAARSFIESCKE